MTASRLRCFQTIACDHLTTGNSLLTHVLNIIYILMAIYPTLNVTSLSAQDFQEKGDLCASFAYLLEDLELKH